MKIYLGVDVGGTNIKFGAFSENAHLLKSWKIPTPLANNGSQILPSIIAEIHQYQDGNFSREDIFSGIGLGIPGPVDRNGFVPACVDLNWKEIYPCNELQAAFPGIPVRIGNDANVAALGEYYYGAGTHHNSLMLVTLGTGVGGGIILNGSVLSGAHGLAGEIGHIGIVTEETERCQCGNTGCIDQFASATGIVRIMHRILKTGTPYPHEGASFQIHSILKETDEFSAADVCSAAKEGDPAASTCLEYCMGILGRGLAYFSHAVDPEIFAVGGGVSNAGEILIRYIRKGYLENIFLTDHVAEIKMSELRNDAGIYGGFALASHDVKIL